MYDYDETNITDVEFALSVIVTNPKRILEIAYGSGRILVSLGKVGHLVTGLDFDGYMLSKISKKSNGDYSRNPIGETTNRAIIGARKK